MKGSFIVSFWQNNGKEMIKTRENAVYLRYIYTQKRPPH